MNLIWKTTMKITTTTALSIAIVWNTRATQLSALELIITGLVHGQSEKETRQYNCTTLQVGVIVGVLRYSCVLAYEY